MGMPFSRHSRLGPRSGRHHRSIHASALSMTSPDWHKHGMQFPYSPCSFARFADHWLSIPAMLSSEQWSYHDLTIVADSSKYLLGQLSGVMKAAASGMVLPRTSHMTDVFYTRLHDGHDVPARVVFRVCVLACRCTSLSCRLFRPGRCNLFIYSFIAQRMKHNNDESGSCQTRRWCWKTPTHDADT